MRVDIQQSLDSLLQTLIVGFPVTFCQTRHGILICLIHIERACIVSRSEIIAVFAVRQIACCNASRHKIRLIFDEHVVVDREKLFRVGPAQLGDPAEGQHNLSRG